MNLFKFCSVTFYNVLTFRLCAFQLKNFFLVEGGIFANPVMVQYFN